MTAGPARAGQAVARVAVGLAVPTVAYYALRGLGVGVHPALVASAAVSALPAVVSLARHRRVHGLSTYVTVMTLGALAVSLLPGSTRFLLAREAVVTGVTGIWFLAGLWARRPLVYLVSRPLLEGRLRWPPDWEALWAASPGSGACGARRASCGGAPCWPTRGCGSCSRTPCHPTTSPALGAALLLATAVVLNVVTHVYYAACGVHDPRSPLRRAGDRDHAVPE